MARVNAGPSGSGLGRRGGARPTLERNQSNSAQAKSIEGGFFLRKKPLGGIAPGYTYSDSALAPRCGREDGARGGTRAGQRSEVDEG
jgi:hypothetical protein